MGQRSESHVGRRPTSGPGLLRTADAKPGTPSGLAAGSFGTDRRRPRIRQTHFGQRRMHRVGRDTVQPNIGQHRRKISRQIGINHVAASC